MIDLSEFESISPYTDAEAVEALGKLHHGCRYRRRAAQLRHEEWSERVRHVHQRLEHTL